LGELGLGEMGLGEMGGHRRECCEFVVQLSIVVQQIYNKSK